MHTAPMLNPRRWYHRGRRIHHLGARCCRLLSWSHLSSYRYPINPPFYDSGEHRIESHLPSQSTSQSTPAILEIADRPLQMWCGGIHTSTERPRRGGCIKVTYQQ